MSDAVRTAWALPGEQPEIPDLPVKGLKTCSVIAATCVRTGALLIEVGEKFQKKEDVRRFIGRVAAETPGNF